MELFEDLPSQNTPLTAERLNQMFEKEELLATINGASETATQDFSVDLTKYQRIALRLYVEWEGVKYYFASEIYDVSLIDANSRFHLRYKKWTDNVIVNLASMQLIETNKYRLSMTIPGSDPSTYFALYGIK